MEVSSAKGSTFDEILFKRSLIFERKNNGSKTDSLRIPAFIGD